MDDPTSWLTTEKLLGTVTLRPNCSVQRTSTSDKTIAFSSYMAFLRSYSSPSGLDLVQRAFHIPFFMYIARLLLGLCPPRRHERGICWQYDE
jgi:hypothetical protein